MERWMLFAIISMLFAGLTSILAKFGMKGLSSDVALAYRTAVVFTIVLINALFFHEVFAELKSTSRSNILFLSLSALTTSLSWIFYYKAIKDGLVSYVTAIDKASLLVAILLSFIILKEPVTPKILAGAGLIFLGTIVLIWK